MNEDLICSWLGLPPGSWPPTHYALLGLEPAESDVERIEQQVHERLARLRQYQLNHPELATEAMNRLARAFTCLTDPKAKQAYDTALLGPAVAATPQPAVRAPAAAEAPLGTAATPSSDPLAFLFGEWNPQANQASEPLADQPVQMHWSEAPPPPVRQAEEPAPPAEPPPAETNGAAEIETPAPAPPPPEPVDPTVQAAQLSSPARRGLGTKRALIYRSVRTRQLLRAWDDAGTYLGQPDRRLMRKADAAELKAQLTAIQKGLEGFPPILGGSGQPGHYVLSLAQLPTIVQVFRNLEPEQRKQIANDWLDGRKLLVAHRDFLRQQLQVLRKKSRWSWVVRAVRSFIDEHPAWVVLIVAFLALLVALCWYLNPS